MRFSPFQIRATAALALLTLVAPFCAPAAKAQTSNEVAVVSIAPLDRTLDDITYLMGAANVPEFGGIFSMMAVPYTQGIDKTKPIGATVTLENGMPNAVIFMPMTDVEVFFDALAGFGVDPEGLGDGLYEIDMNGQSVYAKDQDGWMFVGQTEDSLASVPANPAALLGDLPKTYDLAVRVNLQNLPADVKDMAIEQIRAGYEQAMAMQPDLTEAQRAQNAAAGEASIEQMEIMMDETEKLVFGWAISEEDQRTFMDGGMQFMEGSKLATQISAAANVTSKYAEFILPGASAKFRATSEIAESEREMAKTSFRNSFNQASAQMDNGNLPPEAQEVVDELMASIAELMDKTIDDGVFDGAGSVSVAGGKLRVLMGGVIADGNALADAFKKLASQVPEGAPNAPTFEFDYETYQGVTLHRVVIDAPLPNPNLADALGQPITVTIGTGEKSFLISFDPEGDAAAKAAIDGLQSAEAAKVTPFEGVVSLTSFLEFAQSLSPNPMLENAIATMGEYSGKDKLQVSTRIIPRGMLYRFSVDEGVMKAIGEAAKSGAGGGGGF
ncbi:MAG: hypothetical protein AAF483_06065 [Planctomycetota bacterium]